MDYLVLKALHIAAAATWVGGMLVAGFAISFLPSPCSTRPDGEKRLIDAVRRWDRRVTSPAMLLVWMLGITMAAWHGLFYAPWLLAKLVVVIVLSALHGIQAGTLRRLRDKPEQVVPVLLTLSGPMAIVAVVMVALLAVTKPF